MTNRLELDAYRVREDIGPTGDPEFYVEVLQAGALFEEFQPVMDPNSPWDDPEPLCFDTLDEAFAWIRKTHVLH